MMRLYGGVAVYTSMIGNLLDIQFAEAISEEEAKRKISEASCQEMREQDPRAFPVMVFVKEIPQELIDKHATSRKASEMPRAVIPDEQRGRTQGPHLPPLDLE